MILVAEDNATNQIVVSHALERAGCDVDIANNGREAVHMAQRRDYHCVLMDISMPEMDGLEATAKIKAGERNADTPIIALTAYSLRGDRERFLAAGMTDFLAKPVEKEDLLRCIARNMRASTAAPAGAAPAVSASLAAARDILATMPEELKQKLLQQFVDDTLKRRQAVLEALEASDTHLLERATHALKSVAGTFGAVELTTVAATVNTLARDGKTRQAHAEAEGLAEVCDRTLGEVKDLADEIGVDISFNA